MKNIHVTDAAKQALQQAYDANPGKKAQLRYDAEGSGCAVRGVPTNWLAEKLTGQSEQLAT
ncbi:hypothetical protein MMJ17_26830, partial [Bacillus spizizenii]|nr:hypothetical protein [Bacillus spizizenii]